MLTLLVYQELRAVNFSSCAKTYFTLVKGRDTEHLTLLLALPPVFSFLNQNSTGSIIFRAVEFNLKLTHPSTILLLGHSNDVMHSHPITRTCAAQSPFTPIRVCKAASTISPHTILFMWLASTCIMSLYL